MDKSDLTTNQASRTPRESSYNDLRDTLVTGPPTDVGDGLKQGEVLVGRYSLNERIAGDYLTRSFRALDKQSHKLVLVHALEPGLLSNNDELYAGMRKLRGLMGIRGDNLAEIIAVERHRGNLFIVEPWPPGITLRRIFRTKLMRGQRFSEREFAPVLQGVALALERAHQRSRHANVRAEHVWVDRANTVVLSCPFLIGVVPDERIAALLRNQKALQLAFAPEVISCQATEASDLFGVGAVAHEALMGRLCEPDPVIKKTGALWVKQLQGVLSSNPLNRSVAFRDLLLSFQEFEHHDASAQSPATLGDDALAQLGHRAISRTPTEPMAAVRSEIAGQVDATKDDITTGSWKALDAKEIEATTKISKRAGEEVDPAETIILSSSIRPEGREEMLFPEYDHSGDTPPNAFRNPSTPTPTPRVEATVVRKMPRSSSTAWWALSVGISIAVAAAIMFAAFYAANAMIR